MCRRRPPAPRRSWWRRRRRSSPSRRPSPTTVYVPAYDPNVVYGTWPYPQSPPYYYPPPVGWGVGNALLTGMAFAGGAAIVGSLWGWGSPNWGGGNINVNANRYNNINVNRNQISGNNWQHDITPPARRRLQQ